VSDTRIALLAWVVLSQAAFAEAVGSELADAAERARWDEARTLIEAGTDIDAAQADGTTALMWAAYHDELEIARRLLERGAGEGPLGAEAQHLHKVVPLPVRDALQHRGAGVEREGQLPRSDGHARELSGAGVALRQ